MKKYDVTLTAHYEKNISVYADSPEQAKEKINIVLFDTDLIDFTDEDFVCGEAEFTEANEEETVLDDEAENNCCSECPYYCPVCQECVYEDECNE